MWWNSLNLMRCRIYGSDTICFRKVITNKEVRQEEKLRRIIMVGPRLVYMIHHHKVSMNLINEEALKRGRYKLTFRPHRKCVYMYICLFSSQYTKSQNSIKWKIKNMKQVQSNEKGHLYLPWYHHKDKGVWNLKPYFIFHMVRH